MREYFLFILYLSKNYNKLLIKKCKVKLSFHKFDSFKHIYFNLINFKKLYKYNKSNKNKSIRGHKINYGKVSKKYKLMPTNTYNHNYLTNTLYNIINIQFNIYNYKTHILICNNLGNFYFIPYTQNINLFKFYIYNTSLLYDNIDLQLSYLYTYLYKLKLSTVIFNIYKISNLKNFISKLTYCKSVGSVAKIIMHDRAKLLTYIKLPSQHHIYLNSISICFIYFNPIFKVEEARKIPKASVKKIIGYKSKVRGVAKNSVDHPHGGNTNSIKVKKNPWGTRV